MNFKLILMLVIITLTTVSGQIEQLGLENEKVTSLAVSQVYPFNELIVAGTESHGIFMKSFTGKDTSWVNHYFYNRYVTSVFIQKHGAGPLDYSRIFAGLKPDSLGTTLVYSTLQPIQSYWSRNDSGLSRKEINHIKSFAGFGYSGHEPPQPVFCCAENPYIYILENNVWEKTWSGLEPVSLCQLYTNESTVFACGTFYGFIPTPIVLKSKDLGKTWEEFSPFPNNIAYSITASADDSDTIYVGLNEQVIKSTDGGTSWNSTSLKIEKAYFNSLLINPLQPNQIFAGGKTYDNTFILFRSDDMGKTWAQVDYAWNCNSIIAGINCMVGRINENQFVIYIGTDGDGVLRYVSKITNVESEPVISYDFKLFQNYPNPFNPTTTVEYRVANYSFVTLKVYDILGKEISTLVNDYKRSGQYKQLFNGNNLASGVYYCVLKAGNFTDVRKMVFIK